MLSRHSLAAVATMVAIGSLHPGAAHADGSSVDKVYHPYVQALERELELRFIGQNDDRTPGGDGKIVRFGAGRSWSDRWMTEAYLIGQSDDDSSFSIEAFELEAKLQLTEQGEFWADWGMLFEVEREWADDIWEISGAVLALKEWGRWVTTANLALLYESGDRIDNEWETSLAFQGRYRVSRYFEPALEFYSGEDTRGLGPVATGTVRIGLRAQLRWEAGVILGLDSKTADETYRAMFEFEF